MKKLIAVLLVTFLGAGCSTVSLGVNDTYAITSEKVSRIDEGSTTMEQLNEMFGKPEMNIPAESGAYYFYKDLSLNSLWVVLDDNLTVKKYTWSN
ncbi:hypothetical protein MNBD_NITROSPINAE01-1608 [hydrothermal vent metagenome]|uniref:Lipoprotein SmpA/OmlA domain-containing protein n=1 Tax=hydrothermal vent metagenome TaxID=652676 RepID=A0A3B1CSS4_9ZZZZ